MRDNLVDVRYAENLSYLAKVKEKKYCTRFSAIHVREVGGGPHHRGLRYNTQRVVGAVASR